MTKTCEWISRTLEWAESTRRLPVIYSGCGSMYRNAPAPYLELTFMFEREIRCFRLGDRTVRFPHHHLALHSVHHGSVSVHDEPFRAWCTILDVSAEPVFAPLHDEPVFCTAPVREPAPVLDAYRRLVIYGRRSGWALPSYPPPPDFREARASQPVAYADEVLMKSAFMEILGRMLRNAGDAAAPASNALSPPVAAAVDFMEVRYADPEIALGDIARAASLSPDHFGRTFRAAMGMTPMQYLRRRRAEQAAFLLQNTRMRVEEVGREVGFKDPFHFSRAFRRIHGDSPRHYRARNADTPG